MAEGARLESVFRGNSNVGSNPTLSAMLLKLNQLHWIPNPLSGMCFLFGVSDILFCRAPVRSVKAKTDWIGNQFSIGKERILQTRVDASACASPNKGREPD